MNQELIDARAKMPTDVDKTKMYVNLSQSQAYMQSRCRYSDEMYKYIIDYAKKTNPSLDLAVDVGCGPGCSTIGLAKYFKKVIAVDVSETQIACTPRDIPNIEFKVGYSHQLPFIKDNSVDLFCTGESFHLMPNKETFAEADRVLKPGGTIAIFGYSWASSSNPHIAAAITRMVTKLMPYWPKESQMIFDKFRGVDIPYKNYIRNENMRCKERYNLTKYMGFLRSMFAVVTFNRNNPGVDIGCELEKDMRQAIEKANGEDGGLEFDMEWELFVLMGHKPKK